MTSKMENYPEEAYMWQQCVASTGEIGTFIAPQGYKTPISPVFADSADFFLWAKAHGWAPSAPYSSRYIKIERKTK